MAVTSPDNIRTPDSGDQYALVQDLGVLADSTQAAITKRGNLFAGTAAQRTAFTTATNGMNWQDTDGINMSWKRAGGAWVPSVWRWAGSAAQMNAFTQAPNGFAWYNTTDSSNYTRVAGAWTLTTVKSWAFRYTGGSLTPDAVRVAGQITTTGFTVPADTVVRAHVYGLGVYGTVNLGIAQFKYNTTGAPITTSSTNIPGGIYRKNNISGVVDTISPNVNFVMPTSGVLSLGFTWDRSMYNDPWVLEVTI